MKRLSIFLAIFSLIFCYPQNKQPLVFGEKLTFTSKFLDESAEVWIKYPENFDKIKTECSVLFLLDGEQYFGMANDLQGLLHFGKKMPPTVIVALPSTVESRWKYYTPTNSKNFSGDKENDKLFESTGKFAKFADFVEFELLKYFEKKGIRFKSKTIFGHSMGGLAVMSFYNLRPTVFNNYICASPSLVWNDFMFNRYYSDKYPQNSIENRKLFLSSANPDLNGYKNNVVDLVESLQKKISNSSKTIKYIHYENEDHSTSGIRSLLDGLEYVYAP